MIPTEVYQGHPGTAETTLYTVPAGQRLIGIEIILCNTDTATARTVTMHFRRGGAAAATSNRVLSANRVDASTTVVVKLGTSVLAASGIISGSISAASTITVTISGIQEAI